MLSEHFPKFLIFKAVCFCSLILLAWLTYPAEHAYSIMSHTFSFLGSWSEEHNPRYWWIFTLAMVFWGLAMFPIIIKLYRHFRPVGLVGATLASFFMLLGAIGTILVGLVPDAREILFAETRWTEIHEIAAVMVGIGYALGILIFGILILKDRFTHRRFRAAHGIGPASFVWPFFMWVGVVSAAAYNQITWAQLYEAKKAAAQATGESIKSSWGESLHTIYAFPLWENIVIYALYAFLLWFALVVHWSEKQES